MSRIPFITRLHLTVLVLCLAGVLAAACSSQPTQQALPPQTMAPPPPELEEPISTAPTEPVPEAGSTSAETGDPASGNEAEVAADSAPPDDITVVIEQPAEQEGEQPTSLVAAARAERARRARTGESKIVITDKNLKEHAAGGQVTFVEESEDGAGSGEEATESEAEQDLLEESAADEAYWRDRVSDIRRAWRDAIDRIDELEERIAALRHDFYAEDDPFYRDSQIKPAWDRAIEELEKSRRRARTEQENLADALEEGRRAGALPGWLRDGLELEPTPEELEALGEDQPSDERFHQPSEPVVIEEGEEGPGTDGSRRR